MTQPRCVRLRTSLRPRACVVLLALLLLLFGALPTARAAPLAPSVTATCAASGGLTITGRGFTLGGLSLPANLSGSIKIGGATATFKTTTGGFSASIAPLLAGSYQAKVVISALTVTMGVTVPTCGSSGGAGAGGSGLQTPELASGELFMAALLPILGILAYRRRSARRVRPE